MIIKPIPTNIITGFLGVGKTTLIKQLLATKPEGETWAVLVNEFGEVGIDASLLGDQDGVQIREVAGGCMCCASGVPTQVAINQLIARAKPDRLFIEPTGLGHPSEIINVLSAPHYQNVLALQSTLTLVDARKVSDTRYTSHENFIQQLQVADVVVATKSDVYQGDDLSKLIDYLTLLGLSSRLLLTHSQLLGVSTHLTRALNDASQRHTLASAHTSPSSLGVVNANRALAGFDQTGWFSQLGAGDDTELVFDERGVVCKHKSDEGVESCGWVFHPRLSFDFDAVMALVQDLTTQGLFRLKAVMITQEGIAAINWVDAELTVQEMDECIDSRLELISPNALDWHHVESCLLHCLLPSDIKQ